MTNNNNHPVIITRYCSATTHTPARISAKCGKHSFLLVAKPNRPITLNGHKYAAASLRAQLGWTDGTWVQGALPDGWSFVFVHVPAVAAPAKATLKLAA